MKYYRELAFHLRRQGHRKAFVSQVVAEVESHVETSGIPAEEAFGPAKEYAKSFGDGTNVSWGIASMCLFAFVALAQVAGQLVYAFRVSHTLDELPGSLTLYIALALLVIGLASGRYIDRRLPPAP